MGAVLGNYGNENLIERLKKQSVQVIVPGTRFSCSGRVLAWVFGAQWRGGLELFTELQSGDLLVERRDLTLKSGAQ